MKINNQEKYVVEKIITLNGNMDSDLLSNKSFSKDDLGRLYYSLFNTLETDLFGKSSKTMVCFSGKKASRIMYCEKCNKTHYNNMDIKVEIGKELMYKPAFAEDDEDEYEYIPYEKIQSVICKDCGTEYKFEDIKVVERKNKFQTPNMTFVYKTIFDDNNLVKLSFKTSNLLVEKSFYSEDNRYKITFNTNTGYTYLFNAPTNLNKREKLFFVKASLLNITYRNDEINYALSNILVDNDNEESTLLYSLKELQEKLNKKLSDRLGCSIPTLKEYADEFGIDDENKIYSVRTLSLYNRYPRINTFKLIHMFRAESKYKLEIPKKITTINQACDINNFIDEVARLYNISNKEALAKYINTFGKEGNKKSFKDAILYLSLFDDGELIMKLLNNKSLVDYYYCNSFFDEGMQRKNNRYSSDLMLLKDIASQLGEKYLYDVLCKALSNESMKSRLYDISQSYYNLKIIDKKYKFDLEKIYSIFMDMKDRCYSGDYVSCNDVLINNKNLIPSIDDILYEIKDYLHLKLQKSYSFKIKSIDEYFEEYSKYVKEKREYIRKKGVLSLSETTDLIKNNMLAIKIYKINPTENPYKLLDMFGLANMVYIKELPKFFYTLDNKSTDVIGEILKYYNIPSTKFIRKSLNDNYNNLKLLVYYSKLFKDVNIINNIIKNKQYKEIPSISAFEEMLSNYEDSMLKESHLKDIRIVYDFIKEMIFEKGEAEVSRKIINSKNSGILNIMQDSANMYKAYKGLYEDEEFNFNGSMREIHDRLVDLTGSSERQFKKSDFKPFKYTKEQKELAFKKGDYSFVLPKNGKDLVVIGRELKNCVGTYVDSIRAKKCVIVYVKYKDEYKICIELRSSNSNYAIKQAKLYANNPISCDLEALNIVKDWMDEKDILNDSDDLMPVKNNITQINNRNNYQINNVEIYNAFDEFGYIAEALPF